MSLPELYVGARREIGFAPETVRGTQAVPAAGMWQPHEGFDFRPLVDKVRDEAAVGHIADIINAYRHRLHSEGAVPLRFTKDFILHLAIMILGQNPVTTDIGGGKRRHVVSLKNSNNHKTYSIQVYDPVRGYLAYPLAILVDCAFELNVGAMAKATPNFYAGQEEIGNATSRQYPNTYEYPVYMPHQLSVYIADDLAGLDSAEALDVEGIPFSYGKNAAKRFSLGNIGVKDNVNQRFGAAGTIESAYYNEVFRGYAHADVHKALRIQANDGSGNLVKFDFPRVSFEDWSANPELAAYTKESVAWFAELDTTDGMAKITVENELNASYYGGIDV